VAEGVGRGIHPSLLGIPLHDLLDTTGAEPPATPGLEKPAVLGVGGNVGPEGSGKGLAEEDIPVLRPLPLVDEYLAVFQVHVGDLDAVQFSEMPSPKGTMTDNQLSCIWSR
jgi:hypothetical protein